MESDRTITHPSRPIYGQRDGLVPFRRPARLNQGLRLYNTPPGISLGVN